MKPAQNQYPE